MVQQTQRLGRLNGWFDLFPHISVAQRIPIKWDSTVVESWTCNRDSLDSDLGHGGPYDEYEHLTLVLPLNKQQMFPYQV